MLKKMKFAIVLGIAIIVATTGTSQAQNHQWSACSRTCGQGTRSRPCLPNELCKTRYGDCTVKHCPQVTCPASRIYKYNSVSECCSATSRSACGVVQIQTTSRRVVGGKVSKVGQWPWMAALWQKVPLKYMCGGALINENWVVTAAHCFEDNRFGAKDVTVKLGMSRQSGPNPNMQTTDIEEYIMHPDYKDFNDDLALLKLKTSMRYSTHVHPICMPQKEVPDEDTICYAAGWGFATLTDAFTKTTSDKLLHVGLRVVPLDSCKEKYKNQQSYAGVTNRTLCVGIFGGGKDTCGGDSGSPLVCQRKDSCQWYFAGVVSFGDYYCGSKNSPAVYTNIQVYEEWILRKINPCATAPCQNNGKCVWTPGGYYCQCSRQYKGKNCETVSVGVWLPCSKTCGGGFQYKIERCQDASKINCKRTYRGCNTQKCHDLLSCPQNQKYKYGNKASCCDVSTAETCGIESPSLPSTQKIWPWLASLVLRKSGTIFCAGALITRDWVLSPAHCLDAYTPQDMKVLLGTSTIKSPASVHQEYEIGQTIRHAQYDYPKYDVSLFKLSKSAVLNNFVKPICLPSLEKAEEGTTCLVVGYEFPFTGRRNVPDKVMERFLSRLPMDVCINAYKAVDDWTWNRLDRNGHWCVGKFVGTTSEYQCVPYLSGSLLMCQRCSSCNWYLAGITELGATSCGQAPDIFTSINNFEDWIRTQISLSRSSTFTSCST